MADELSERLIDAEVRLAYQDRTITALDDAVRELARRVAALEAQLAALRAPPRPTTES
jgi:uncharacterized coiled-coil protein SlyX